MLASELRSPVLQVIVCCPGHCCYNLQPANLWSIPLAWTLFPEEIGFFLLPTQLSHNSYWLQTRGSPYCLHTVPWPRGLFSTPVLGSLTLTVSHVSVQPTPFSTLIRISLLSLLHESQLREQGRAACH